MTIETPSGEKLPARFASSPTFDPKLPLERIIELSVRGGFQSMEVMTSWAAGSVNLDGKPEDYRSKAAGSGLAITSFHMPPIKSDDPASLDRALDSLRFAKALGAEVAIYKADSIDTYARHAKAALDAADAQGIQLIIYNHSGSIISTIEDYQTALDAIADERMGVLLEVGHFHAAGVAWQDALATFGDRIKLMHFKDMQGDKPVPYGTGEIDFVELFRALNAAGYSGRMVLELEKVPPEQVADQLRQAVAVTEKAWADAA